MAKKPTAYPVKINCNLCGNDKGTLVYTIPSSSKRIKKTYTITQCLLCGLVFIHPRPSDIELQQVYEEDYFSAKTTDNTFGRSSSGMSHRYLDYRKNTVFPQHLDIIKTFKKKGKLLDIGCGVGDFLVIAQQSGFDVYGNDISEDACAQAAQKGIKAKCGNIVRTLYKENTFDVITMWAILDHLKDPKSTLRNVARYLKKGGYLFVNISNYDSFRRLANGSDWRVFRPPEHLFYYSLNTATLYLADAGVTLEKVFGAGEIDVDHVINNPDKNLVNTTRTARFNWSNAQRKKMLMYGRLFTLAEKKGILGWTVGSNLVLCARKNYI